MKPVYLLSALFLFSLRAQAPTPVPLARGNAPGEPHHHLKIENEYVRAYYVEVPPHGETQLHQHDNDYIFVSLGPADVTNAVLGKPEVHLQLKDGEVRFTRGGFAHAARNNSDAPFRNVTIEFLRPQGEVHNLCKKIVDGPLGPCRITVRPAVEVPLKEVHSSSREPWFETDELRVDLLNVTPDVPSPQSKTQRGDLLVCLDGAKLYVRSDAGQSSGLQSGGVVWIPSGAKWAATDLRESDSKLLVISFKDVGTSPSN